MSKTQTQAVEKPEEEEDLRQLQAIVRVPTSFPKQKSLTYP